MAKFNQPTPPSTDYGSRAIGVFMPTRKNYGQLAAPVVPGRPRGLDLTPALTGLFQRGDTVGISQINMIATVVPRG